MIVTETVVCLGLRRSFVVCLFFVASGKKIDPKGFQLLERFFLSK